MAYFIALYGNLISQPAAAARSPWRGLADNVFQLVVRNADLPSAIVPVTISQDHDGFIWLGGDNGLIRWDGYEFQGVSPDLAHAASQAPGISVVHRDKQGQLWAGTTSRGLARLNLKQVRLVCVALSTNQCGTEHVWSIDDDGASGLWVGASTGLFHVDTTGGKAVTRWVYSATRHGSLPANEVFAVLRDRNGVLWVGTSHGLARLANDKVTFVGVPLMDGPSQAVSHLMEDKDGRIWIGTRQTGAYVLSADRLSLRSIPATAPASVGDVSLEVTSMLEIAPGRVWIGTYGQGIFDADALTLQGRHIVHDSAVKSSLSGDMIMSMYRDRSGLVWIGTEEGLSQYNLNADGFMTFSVKSGGSSPAGGSVMAALAAPDGSIWTGLQSAGFAILKPDGQRIAGLSHLSVYALTPAPTDGVLIGTNAGLFLSDWSGRHVSRLIVPQLSPIADIRTVRTIYGVIWLGARDDGLRALVIDSNMRVTLVRYETAPRLASSAVEVIAAAPDGRVAVGSNGSLDLIDPHSLAIEHIAQDPANPFGLGSGQVTCFATDSSGKLWVGTSDGLSRLDGWVAGQPRFHHIGTSDGLPNGAIDSLLVDKDGLLWASTDMGLATVDPNTLKVLSIQRSDGLAITNYWDNSAAVLSTGELVFGGLGGLSMVSPEAVTKWSFQPQIAITALRIGKEPIPVDQQAPESLIVTPSANSVIAEFAALDYSAPSRNIYSYRLDGYDNAWISADASHRIASYTNLAPGRYVLWIKGTNRDGLWSGSVRRITIEVLPAWYQTLGFRLNSSGLVVLMLVLFVRFYTRFMRRRQRDLEDEVTVRTAALSVTQFKLIEANAELETRVLERTHALASSEARFRAWFDHSEDAVFILRVDGAGEYVYEAANPAAERISGVPVAMYVGRQPREVLPAQVAAELVARYREGASGQPVQFETQMVFDSGERLIDVWIRPVVDLSTGQVDRLVSAFRDVTERRAVELRCVQTQKLQALGELASGVAHDFNNILQTVGGAAALIQSAAEDYVKVKKLARRMIDATERGASITSRLLAFARSDTLQEETVQTREVLESVCEIMSDTLGSSITVLQNFCSELPPLRADRGQLQTAIINLGTNARDAMEGHGVITVTADTIRVAEGALHRACLTPGAYVQISVADTGGGMTAETISRAVEPFFTTKPQGKGTGLGLGLVKGFSEQSGGGMAISSSSGRGTTVSIWLREAQRDSVTELLEAQRDNVTEPKPQASSAVSPGRILVVDDDHEVRDTVKDILIDAGFCVSSAESGKDALALIQRGMVPDALLCDQSMPGLTGVETIRMARELLPDLPSFLLTGYPDESVLLETSNHFKLLRKPILVADLVAKLEARMVAQNIG